MDIFSIRSVLILAVLVFGTIHCQGGKTLQTEVSDNRNSNVSIIVNNVTETPINVTTLPGEPTTTSSTSSVTPPTTEGPNTTTVTTSTSPTTKSTPTTNATTPTTPTTPTSQTTSSTTTVSPNTTTVTPATSAKPVDPTTTPAPHKDRHFDGASFIGGIILAVGLMGIAFIAFKFYKARTERNYHTL